jgi:hypothetical protein
MLPNFMANSYAESPRSPRATLQNPFGEFFDPPACDIFLPRFAARGAFSDSSAQLQVTGCDRFLPSYPPSLSSMDRGGGELMALCDRLALQQQERETRHTALARASLARFADAPTRPTSCSFP